MSDRPRVILSAFADEAANHKTAIEQLSVMAAVGLRYYSPRFIDVNGSGEVKHVVELDDTELARLNELHEEFGMSVTGIGARIGKIKLLDQDDGSHNVFVPFDEYLDGEVADTIRVAQALDTKLIRGFSFYHPQGTDPREYIPQAVDQLGQIVERTAAAGLVYGLEIEPNLIGETGELLAELCRQVGHPGMVCIYDGGNVAAQNKNRLQVHAELVDMIDHIGWMHIKDYTIDPGLTWTGAVDEERLKNFVPADVGDAGHDLLLRELKGRLPELEAKMVGMGAPGFFLEVEPHLKGGGQFGGFSGPDGIGVSVRSLCRVLDYVGIDYALRDFSDIQQARGF